MKTGRIDCVCGDQIISNSGKTMNKADDWKKIACWGCWKLYDYDSVEAFRIEGQAVIYRLKVYKMNDCDWWMDTDLEAAKKHYLEFVCDNEDSLDNPRELTESELDTLIFKPDEDDRPECTFREWMSILDQKPQFFASTEY